MSEPQTEPPSTAERIRVLDRTAGRIGAWAMVCFVLAATALACVVVFGLLVGGSGADASVAMFLIVGVTFAAVHGIAGGLYFRAAATLRSAATTPSALTGALRELQRVFLYDAAITGGLLAVTILSTHLLGGG